MVPILSKIIGAEQTGFLPGRQITDNVIFAQLIQEYCKLRHIDAILVFLDQEKAYDRVEHSFLAAVLKKMGFPLRFVRWILMLYKDAASQVLVNGHLSPAFSIGRGVRQGDPLSCLLFICVIEVLSLALRKELPGLRLPGNTTATHSMYADDTMAILNGTRELPTLQRILDRYGRASGARINFTKSEMLPLGTLKPDRGIPTNIPWADDGKTITYLGCPIGNNIDINDKWNSILDSIKCFGQKWKSMNITLKGRILIAKVMLCSRLWYHARVLPLSDALVNEITAEIWSFIWKGGKNKVSAATCVQPIEKGGLNMLDIRDMVDAVRVQWVRRLFDDKVQHQWKAVAEWVFNNSYITDQPHLVSNIWIQNLNSKLTANLPPFWKNVLESWKRLRGAIWNDLSNAKQAGTLPIWYNSRFLKIGSNISEGNQQLRRVLRVKTLSDISEPGVGFSIDLSCIPDPQAAVRCEQAARKIWFKVLPYIRQLIEDNCQTEDEANSLFCLGRSSLISLKNASVSAIRKTTQEYLVIKMVSRLNAATDEALPWPKI
jgi:hypothetical protein